MKKLASIGSIIFLLLSCTQAKKDRTTNDSLTATPLIEKISDTLFKSFVYQFAVSEFPYDMKQTPFFVESGYPEYFKEICLSDVQKYINSDANDAKGYYSGYAIFDSGFIALICFYSSSTIFGGENYSTEVTLCTFNYEGKRIDRLSLGSNSTRINEQAHRVETKITGSVNLKFISNLIPEFYLEDKPDGTGTPFRFILMADGSVNRNPSQVDDGCKYLFVEGDEIPMKLAPSSDQKVFDLKDKDRCKIVGTGPYEVIEGQADCWYQVEKDGIAGWIFGANTSEKSNLKPLIGDNCHELWKTFQNYQNEQITKHNDGLTPEEIAEGESYKLSSDRRDINAFSILEGSAGSHADYSLLQLDIPEICCISRTHLQEGAYGFLNHWSIFIGIRQQGTYFLYVNDFDGRVEKFFKIGEHEYSLVTFQSSGDQVAAFVESYCNVYIINTATFSIHLANSQLGRHEWSMDKEASAAIGELIEKDVKLVFSGTENAFEIVRYRSKKAGDGSMVPFDSYAQKFTWHSDKSSYVSD